MSNITTKSSPSPSQSSSDAWSCAYRCRLIDRVDVARWAQRQRYEGRTIATLNGSFDLLHAGHLQIFYEASLQADRLLVALNTDSSIRGYKGANRPLIPLEQRLQMVAALRFVDAVTWFDELDPRQLLEEVRPDVHCNGSEYGTECIEAEIVRSHGGRIHCIQLVPGFSTSALIRKIQGEAECV